MTTAGTLHAQFRTLPETTLDALIAPGTPLILAPHQDDESLGCGGLIAACVEAGRPPLLAFLTDGAGSHPNSRQFPPARLRALREIEALAAASILGLAPGRVLFLRAPDTALPREGEALTRAVDTLAAFGRGTTTVLTTWRHDPHCDHAAAAAIGSALATRLAARLLFYPVWGWTLAPEIELAHRATTGWRLPIAPLLARKHAAIAAHRSQHAGLITDDPAGFILPEHLLGHFRGPHEVFLDGATA